MGQDAYLIVRQQRTPPENFQSLLQQLSRAHKLDRYSCRQKIIGQGLAVLHEGAKEDLQQLVDLLRAENINHWLVEPTRPAFAPTMIRSLNQTGEGITFTCQKKQVRFDKEATVLAVLGDLSGQLADRSAKQLMSSYTYQGKDNLTHLSEAKIYKTILENKPVLDLYLLDSNYYIADAVRIVPGKFDHKGLGEKATLSSRRNLHNLLELCRENAGQFYLETGLGLSQLPGCAVQRLVDDNMDILRKNLSALTHYGWLMAALKQQGETHSEPAAEDELSGAVTAALLAQNPALAGSEELTQATPVIRDIAAEIKQATADSEQSPQFPPEASTRTLPAPPEPVRSGRNWRSPRIWLGSIGGLITATTLITLGLTDHVLPALIRYGFQLGGFPALCGALMFWGGFHFLRLKRQVENTPTSKIRSVAMGMVEVKGKAIRQYALISPKTHIACAWYRLTNYHREGNKNWVINSVVSSSNVPFLLEDDTGRISINPEGAAIRAGNKKVGFSNRNSISLASAYGNRGGSEKWVEEIIYEGTNLYVLGFAATKTEEGPSLQQKKVEALRELKRDPAAMKQFDTDGDGRISETEWEDARAAVENQVLKQSLKGKDRRRRQEEQIAIGKPTGRRPFIIAETHSECHLTRRFALYAVPLFIGAALCTAWTVSILVKWLL